MEEVKVEDMIKEIASLKAREQGCIHGNPVTDGWAGAVM